MTIGIIGSGKIGGTLARLLARAGHDVLLSNSRGPDSLESTIAQIGPSARAAYVEEAAGQGDLVIEAIPFGHYGSLPPHALAGKTLVTASNYYPDRDGPVEGADTRPTTLLVAEHLPGTRLVKAFNTIRWDQLGEQGDPSRPLEARRVIPLAGDDEQAKLLVSDLIEQLGFGPLDLGTLAQSDRMQPGAPIYNRDLTLAEARALVQTG
jgi:predicted dinucleotide-binding enzyme